MHLDRETGEITHGTFTDVYDILEAGDTLVINDTKVIPARLYGVREGTLGKVEILLLKRTSADTWETLVKPGKKCRTGARILFGSPDGRAETSPLIGEITDVLPDGNRMITFKYEGIFEEVLETGRATTRYMRSTRDRRLRRRRGFILRRSFLKRLRRKVLISPM